MSLRRTSEWRRTICHIYSNAYCLATPRTPSVYASVCTAMYANLFVGQSRQAARFPPPPPPTLPYCIFPLSVHSPRSAYQVPPPIFASRSQSGDSRFVATSLPNQATPHRRILPRWASRSAFHAREVWCFTIEVPPALAPVPLKSCTRSLLRHTHQRNSTPSTTRWPPPSTPPIRVRCPPPARCPLRARSTCAARCPSLASYPSAPKSPSAVRSPPQSHAAID